jgi:uncharacterized protein VirK/YbjX
MAHFVRCAAHLALFREWLGNTSNPLLEEALLQRPSLVTRVLHPYLNADWSLEHKLATISGHYETLRGPLAFLRFPVSEAITLATLGESLRILLDKPGRFEHEGELAINLFRSDSRLYSLVFTLGQINGQKVAYIGGLQGTSGPDALELYRSITHRMHGLRPRDLLVTAFRLLCVALGVSRILAISDSNRVCSQSYFKSNAQVFTSYNSVWIESGASASAGGFYELNPHYLARAAEDIPTRKRALYRRRYAMIADIATQIGAVVGRHDARPNQVGVTPQQPWTPRDGDFGRVASTVSER